MPSLYLSPSRTPLVSESSSLYPSVITTSSVISSETIPGIGALSGKFIYSVGKTILHGAESVVVHRRLSYIQSLCPLSDDRPPKDVGQIYDDIIELSRYVMSEHIYSGIDSNYSYADPAYILSASERKRCI
jgi:hypothetical protein